MCVILVLVSVGEASNSWRLPNLGLKEQEPFRRVTKLTKRCCLLSILTFFSPWELLGSVSILWFGWQKKHTQWIQVSLAEEWEWLMKQRGGHFGAHNKRHSMELRSSSHSCLLSVPSTLTLSSGHFPLCPVIGLLSPICPLTSQRVPSLIPFTCGKIFFSTQCFNQNYIDTNLFSWMKYFLDSTVLK